MKYALYGRKPDGDIDMANLIAAGDFPTGYAFKRPDVVVLQPVLGLTRYFISHGVGTRVDLKEGIMTIQCYREADGVVTVR